MRAIALSLMLLFGLASSVGADGGSTLSALVAQATGINRTVDDTLTALAQTRSAEITVTFAHRPMPELANWNWGEVIASNRGYADPYATAIDQWQGSPSHWAILTDQAYQRIGCDHRLVGDRHYFVCILGTVGGWTSPPEPPPIIGELPDTAMGAR